MANELGGLTLREIAFGDVPREIEVSRRMLERVPMEHFDWAPAEKAFPLGPLAWHVAHLLHWGTVTARQDELDLATEPMPERVADRERLLATFDRHAGEFTAALAAVPDDAWGRTWTLKQGGQVFLQLPRHEVMRRLVISHHVHHRAQLVTYFRQLGVAVPALYGPSGDERG